MSTIPPSKQTSAQLSDAQTATSAHPPQTSIDPTVTSPSTSNTHNHAAAGGNTTADATGPAKLARLRGELKAGLRQFPDFPSPGILFEDIMPLFADVKLHNALIDALAMLVQQHYNNVDVVVGLDSRGFLFGPSLALRLNAGFVPVRKQGKLPGPCETEGFKKEYGEDFFQLQSDAIKPGQKVLVVDDIIATGMYRS